MKAASGSLVETSPSLCGGAGDRRFDQRRFDQRAGLQHQALGVELAVQFGEQNRGEATLGQRGAETAQRRLVRRSVVQAEAAEAAERQPV